MAFLPVESRARPAFVVRPGASRRVAEATRRPALLDRIGQKVRTITLGELADLVIQHGDVREDLGQGQVIYRVSRAAALRPEIRRAFGRALDRALVLNVVWDEVEGERVRVFETPARAETARTFGAYVPRTFDEDAADVWAQRTMDRPVVYG